jgi:uncharacterized surface protein with fasciclin (FAS1) repeats
MFLKALASVALLISIATATVFPSSAKAQEAPATKTEEVKVTPTEKPASTMSILNKLSSFDYLSTLVTFAKQAEVTSALEDQDITVFAPRNSAFALLAPNLEPNVVEKKMEELRNNKPELAKILANHVVKGRYTLKDLKNGQVLTTIGGGKLMVVRQGKLVTIRSEKRVVANIVTRNQTASNGNGVIHIVDKVLLPKQPKSMTK